MPELSNSADQLRHSTNNYILKSLPDEDFARLSPDLERVGIDLGQIIYRPEEPIEYIYFPGNAMISVVANAFNGQSAEVGVIGNEGIVGVDALMGSDATLNEHIVQLPGVALRGGVDAVRREFGRARALQKLTLSFIRLLMLQISQTALCNRLHSNEERLSRWLLMCRDRTVTDKLRLTQEFLSIMLGSNRATVTLSAITLQEVGYIKYVRGLITILDREGLEDFTCDCYQTIKREYSRIQQKD